MKEVLNMRNISDIIEHHLKEMLVKSSEYVVEIQRNDLADHFQCVPSQINYVISTRFTPEKGYFVESKRGGGGYVRIQRLQLPEEASMQDHIFVTIGNNIDQASAEGLIYQLEMAELLSRREAMIMKAAIIRETIPLQLPFRDELRAKLMKAMLIAAFTSDSKGGGR
jgi:transcriptional regulator CtsR